MWLRRKTTDIEIIDNIKQPLQQNIKQLEQSGKYIRDRVRIDVTISLSLGFLISILLKRQTSRIESTLGLESDQPNLKF